ncbi:MAB_1171c family putative transporter [Nocardia altamirensis]|uniref:MAB_1171c family putative transporter n=1 Tax=Nocardia altamirensis TaxID=472158 RepID=UPI00083FE268|nr:MAB_1171c family putative transporter [Nocardia altamirensis]
MNSAPSLLVAAFVVLVGLIVVGRWLFVHETITDHLINRALAWDAGALLLFCCCAAVGYRDLGQRLFLGVSAMALSKCIGCARLFDGADPRLVDERQRRYDVRAAVLGVFVILSALAEVAGVHMHRLIDWEAIVWAITEVFIFWIGLLLVRCCLRELRAASPTPRERLTYSALLFLGCYDIVSSAYTFMATATGTAPGYPGTLMAVASLVAVVLLVLLLAVPLFEALLVRAHLDFDGRQCRRLNPLWRDLTAAVPEVVLHTERPRGSSSRLYRMTVEIRDALLHLKQFTAETGAVRTDDIRAYAVDIAEAAQRRRQGIQVLNPGTVMHLRADDRADELRNLLALSREWPRARATVTGSVTSLR